MVLAILLLALAAVLVSTVPRTLSSPRAAVYQAGAIVAAAAANLAVLTTTRDSATRALNLATSITLVGALYRWSFMLRARRARVAAARRDDTPQRPGRT